MCCMKNKLVFGLLSLSVLLFGIANSASAQTAIERMVEVAGKPAEKPRIKWFPNCGTIETNLGPAIVATTQKDIECMMACVENTDGENFRAYQYYCLENYDEEQCSSAIRRLDADRRCRLDCCEALQGLREQE